MTATMDQVPVALRDGIVLVPDGMRQAAARLQAAFGDHAIAVAERWAERDDVRWRVVANILRHEGTP